jgi:hypothetical protein
MAQNFFRPARRRVPLILGVSAGSANAARREKGKPTGEVISELFLGPKGGEKG